MVLVGLFSTYFTYLLFAVVYIFGYGAYALNCKKNQCSSKEDLPKQIAYNNEETESTSVNKNDCFYWSEVGDTQLLIIEEEPVLNDNYNILKNIKAKEHFCSLRYNYKIISRLIARPPPFFA